MSLVSGLLEIAEVDGLGLEPRDRRRGLAVRLKSPVLDPARVDVII